MPRRRRDGACTQNIIIGRTYECFLAGSNIWGLAARAYFRATTFQSLPDHYHQRRWTTPRYAARF